MTDIFVKSNPLLQFPTLILPDGAVMTEMAAILLCELSCLFRVSVNPDPFPRPRTATWNRNALGLE